jgi:hypothetical protein
MARMSKALTAFAMLASIAPSEPPHQFMIRDSRVAVKGGVRREQTDRQKRDLRGKARRTRGFR